MLPSVGPGGYVAGMRITSTGRVTIPKRIRDRYGMLPGSTVEFVDVGGEVAIRAVPSEGEDRAEWLLSRMRGSAQAGMTTDEVMELTRHYSEDPLLQ